PTNRSATGAAFCCPATRTRSRTSAAGSIRPCHSTRHGSNFSSTAARVDSLRPTTTPLPFEDSTMTERPTRLLPLLLLALACESGGGAEPAAVVRDSAGIAIVEHAPTASATLHVVSEPVLEIGAVEGADEYQLYGVRSVARASDGTIVVALDTELRWYDPAGRFVRRAGRAGEGPGEFRRISYMRLLPGDTVLVFDGANRRTTIIAPDGSHVRDFTSGDEGQISTIVGATHDGTLLVRRFTAGSTSITSGLQRNDVEFSIVRGDSTI